MNINNCKEIILKLYLISSFFFIILSLGSNLAYIQHVDFSELFFKIKNINNVRGLLPLIIFLVKNFFLNTNIKYCKKLYKTL